MSTYTSTVTLCKDLVSVLVSAGFVNDETPVNSEPPNRPVFRLGVSNIQPMVDDMGNTDKTTIEVRIEIAYLYPIGGGNPQQAEFDIVKGVEDMLDAIATTPTLLDAGTALSFTQCRIRNIRPSYNRADITLESVLNIP